MSISVEFMGLKLKSPIIAASGPWNRDSISMKKALACGAGAVVTETIVNEVRKNVRPRLIIKGSGIENIGLYSDISLEKWEKEIYLTKEAGGTVIANILAYSPSEIAYIARSVEKFGADAIEIGAACPHGEGVEIISSDISRITEFTEAVVDSVNIPVMVKFSPSVTNMAEVACAVEEAGAAGISGIDTVRAIMGVDVENEKPLLPSIGGYSGAPIRPIGMAAVATIAKAVNLPVCGIGGIENYYNVLEYMMLGASTVQVGSSILLKGYDVIYDINKDLEHWLENSKYDNISEITGKALDELKTFESLKVEPYTAHIIGSCDDISCQKCVVPCVYDAIDIIDGNIRIDSDKCKGCGLCVGICPKRIIEMIWK